MHSLELSCDSIKSRQASVHWQFHISISSVKTTLSTATSLDLEFFKIAHKHLRIRVCMRCQTGYKFITKMYSSFSLNRSERWRKLNEAFWSKSKAMI